MGAGLAIFILQPKPYESMFKLRFLLPLLCLTPHLFGQAPSVLSYSDATQYIETSRYAAVLEDAKKELTIEQIIAMPDSCFQQKERIVLNLGNSNSRFWVRFSVNNQTGEDLYWLNIYSVIHYLDLYVVSENGEVKAYPPSGSLRPFENRTLPLPNLNFNLGKHPKTLFMSLQTKQGFLFSNLIGSKDAIYSFARRDERIAFFYLGFSFVLGIYNLAIYINSRDPPFLWYVLFQIGIIFIILHMSGFGYQYVWRHFPIINADANAHFGLPALASSFFSMSLLNTRNIIPLFHRFLLGLVTALCGAMLLQPLGLAPLSNQLSGIIIFLMYTHLWIAGWLVWFKNHKTARFYLLGWTIYLVSSLLTVAVGEGYFQYIHDWVLNGYWVQFGSMSEALLLTLALADRVREIREQARDANALALQRAFENEALMAKQNQLMEDKLQLEQQNNPKTASELPELLEKIRKERPKNTKLHVPTTEGVLWIPTQDIIRLEAMRAYCSIHLTNGKRIVASNPLSDFEKQLDTTEFMRVHKSHLVNLSQIQEYIRGEGGALVLKDGSTVSVSRTAKAAVLARLGI